MSEDQNIQEQGIKQGQASDLNQEEAYRNKLLEDYRIANISREASLLGRREVLTGKAKFGIFGDGKELAQIVMSHMFREGDFRSGYYRDQTFMFHAGLANVKQFFAQLYADPDLSRDPFSGGRQMNAHFATPLIDKDGKWLDQTSMKNSSADGSPTASQMPRSIGLAYASKYYRNIDELKDNTSFSHNGDEVAFVTIGDASTSEGMFWETVNAAGVLKVPLAIFVWDDGYGISVPKKYQTTKGSISEILSGFQTDENGDGIDIYRVKGWDYYGMYEAFEKGIQSTRENHRPVLFHVEEVTQPQGHSTSGSHERYKSKERLEWEVEYDCIRKMREWMLDIGVANVEELDAIEEESKKHVREAKSAAWKEFLEPIKQQISVLKAHLDQLAANSLAADEIGKIKQELGAMMDPVRKDVVRFAKRALYVTREESSEERRQLIHWLDHILHDNERRYGSHLYSESNESAIKVPEVKPVYSADSKTMNGFEVLNKFFDSAIERDPRVCAFGEDVGKIGDVNQGFAGLQEKHGVLRVSDTGIRETTIIGQGIGMALRGLRPIAEIQYLDYLIYGLQPLTDDLATLQYRTVGQQKAPLIVRTRGHRLEGIWHTGSPIGMILHTLRGMNVLVPRNMVQAAGMYNTMLQSDEPALIIECLNGYRLKERMPDNLGEFTVPLGKPDILKEGDDVTIVTYGSCVRIAEQAIDILEEMDISCELVDVQTLLPFDVHHVVLDSIKKTNRVVFMDEDVPGGASAYMMQQVLEGQGAYRYLDSLPKTLTSKAHRTSYGSDGDYFGKPNAEDLVETVYALMHEADPHGYPELF